MNTLVVAVEPMHVVVGGDEVSVGDVVLAGWFAGCRVVVAGHCFRWGRPA